MSKYALGVDYGTLSARALVVEIGTGREVGEAVMDYPHGVMSECLPDGTRLEAEWALQHPQDYLDALAFTVTHAVAAAGVKIEDIVGVGIDFTSCTLLAVDEAGRPLCEKYPSRPHAYVKLWKHHAGQPQADRMTRVAEERGEKWLKRYGGKVSSEWMMPKILETLEKDPALYRETAHFVDAGDWLVWRMTGEMHRSAGMAGYKAFWSKGEGYPSPEYFAACNPDFRNVVSEKLGPVTPIGAKAGGLTAEMAQDLGLLPGTPVAVANIDAHVSVPAAGLTEPGSLLMIMGTSTCDILLCEDMRVAPGICGAVEDGAMPGLVACEAGQSCVGDHFRWFTENCVPGEYHKEAAARGISVQQYLTELAQKLNPGESGLLALDWWNGNRSVLVNAELSGLMLGMTLNTRAEEIYRALIEGTAFGARTIVENFEASGVPIHRVVACGGISRKNPFMMQLYADVLHKEICVARSSQTPALGSAMFGAVAAGKDGGGYDSIFEAAREMGGVSETVYRPDPARCAVYDVLFAEYSQLHDYFGRGGSEVMKRLKRISAAQRQM